MSDQSKIKKRMSNHERATAHAKSTGHSVVSCLDFWKCANCEAGNREPELLSDFQPCIITVPKSEVTK